MRELFRFLHRVRHSLLFAALMAISLLLVYNGNMQHRASAIASSNAVTATIYGWRSDITEYTSLREVNRSLAQENAQWRSTCMPGGEDSLAEGRVDTMGGIPFAYLHAKVINSTAHKQRNYLTLDRGALHGLDDDMGVIGPDGIVGVVHRVSPRFATVISVLSPDIRTSVQIRRTGHFGLLYWDTGDPRTASVIDIAKHARVQVGDTVETRGGDGIFPSGIPVGVVERVSSEPGDNYLRIRIDLSEDMTRNGYVYVVRDLHRMERDSLQADIQGP